MKTVVLPAIWYTSAATTTVGVFARHVALNSFAALALAWFCSIAVALLAGGVVVRVKPDLRFSTREHTDGLGYTHQPFGAIVSITVIAALSLVVMFFRR